MSRSFPLVLQFALTVLVACDDQYLAPPDDGEIADRYYGANPYYGESSYYGDAYAGATVETTIDCGEDNHQGYKNTTRVEKCVRLTFTNRCDFDSFIQVEDADNADVGDVQTVGPNTPTNIDMDVPAGGKIEIDCGDCSDGSACEGCSYSLNAC